MFVNETFSNYTIFIINYNMGRKLTKELFIEKACKIHNNKYDYSLSQYTYNNCKLKIICSTHGIFEQTPNNHLNGKGCIKCGFISGTNKKLSNNLNFIRKATSIHNIKYDYSLVNYINNYTKVKIICKEHGVFELKPNCHLTGGGCPRCVGRGKTTEDFIKESIIIHGDKYDYSISEYDSTHKKINIVCIKHGVFKQTPNQHLNGGGCPICNYSKGERNIRNYLIQNNIEFISQYRFSDCKDIRTLPFDFYLSNINTCIEYQGIQHFKPVNYFGGTKTLISQKNRDKIKSNYCCDKNINLIIIKYDENIYDKLKKYNLTCNTIKYNTYCIY